MCGGSRGGIYTSSSLPRGAARILFALFRGFSTKIVPQSNGRCNSFFEKKRKNHLTSYFFYATIVTQQVTSGIPLTEYNLLCNFYASFYEKLGNGSSVGVIRPREGSTGKKKGVEKTVFFTKSSRYEGEPVRLYRTPEEIRQDIESIRTRIEDVNSMLNARHVLTEMMSSLAEGEPERWIPALSQLVDEAQDSLELLRSLKETLDALLEELEETRWVLTGKR